MKVYVIVLLLIVFFSKAVTNDEASLVYSRVRLNNYIAIFIMASLLIMISGLRYHVGADFFNYVRLFGNRSFLSFDEVAKSVVTFQEGGFDLICVLVGRTGGNYTVMFTVIAFLTIFPAMIVIFRYSPSYSLSMLLYVLLVWDGTFGAIRQCLAASIVFCGFSHLRSKEFWKYTLLVILAAQFHFTAIAMLPLYFILTQKFTFRNVVLIAISSVILRSSYESIFSILSTLKDSEFGDYSYLTTSVNVFRVLVAFAPSLLLLLAERDIESREYSLSANVLLLHGFLMFAMSRSAYLARFPIYTSIFLTVAIPEIICRINKNAALIRIIMLTCYIIYWIYGIRVQGMEYSWIFQSNI